MRPRSQRIQNTRQPHRTKAIVTLPDKDTPLIGYQQHLSDKEVAEFLRDEDAGGVGREYKTHGDVWNAKPEIVLTGLLHLILDELEKLNDEPKDQLELHSRWLTDWYDRVVSLIAEHDQQCERIAKFCDLELLRRDVDRQKVRWFSIIYRQDIGRHRRMFEDLQDKVKRLRRVKSLADIEKLDGIGKKMAEAIRRKMSEPK